MDRHPRRRCALRIVLGGAVGPRPAHGVTDRSGGSVRFGRVPPITVGCRPRSIPADVAVIQQRLGAGSRHQVVLATVAAFVARAASATSLEVAYPDPEIQATVTDADALFPAWVPLHVPIASDASFTAVARAVLDDLAAVSERRTFARDVVASDTRASCDRRAGASGKLADSSCRRSHPAGFARRCLRHHCCRRWSTHRMASPTTARCRRGRSRRWRISSRCFCMRSWPTATSRSIGIRSSTRSIASACSSNGTPPRAITRARPACISCSRRRPSARPMPGAVIFEGKSLSYAELDARANRIARRLLGAGRPPRTLVGLAVPRASLDMVVARSPCTRPAARTCRSTRRIRPTASRFMIEDSRRLSSSRRHEPMSRAATCPCSVLALDEAAEREAIDQLPASDRALPRRLANLAYVIYTSGSTGRPKGVMVEHRNVVNFFAGMDAR